MLRDTTNQFSRSGDLRSSVTLSFWLFTLTIILSCSLSILWCDCCYLVWFILSLGWWAVGCCSVLMPLNPGVVGQSCSQGCSLLPYESSSCVVLSKWGNNLLIPIEVKLLEGKFAAGKELMKQEIILVCFFPLECGKCPSLAGKPTFCQAKGGTKPMFSGVGTW